MEVNKRRLLFGCVFFLAIVPIFEANIVHFDQYWQNRSDDAKKAAQQAYKPNPQEITSNLNMHVHKYVLFINFNMHLLLLI